MRFPSVLATLAISALLPFGQLFAQEAFKPESAYFDGFMLKREAAALLEEGDAVAAEQKYRSALRLYRSIQTVHPDFKSDLVADTIRKLEESVFSAAAKASSQRDASTDLNEVFPTAIEEPGAAPVMSPEAHQERRTELDQLYAQIQKLKGQLARAEADRSANRTQLRTTIMQLEKERAAKANAPLKEEMDALARRLQITAEERDAMAVALKQSRAEQRQLKAQNQQLLTDLAVAKGQVEQLKRDIADERGTNNQLVRRLREQQDTLVEQITTKERDFEAAQEKISYLQTQLDESMEVVAELRDERDSLLVERDRLSDLLALTDSERSKELIHQNMLLGKQLTEAKENLQRVANSENLTKDELHSAKTDLAVAKARIEHFVKLAAEQDRRIKEKEEKLQQVQLDLENESFASSSASPVDQRELRLLRDVAQRQLRQQTRRRQAKQLLIDHAQELGVLSDLLDPIKALAGPEIGLNEEERALVENAPASSVDLFSVEAAPVEVRERAQRRLQEQISSFSRVGQRAFKKGRFTAAAEVFELILDEHPGHVESLLKLGVISRKLQNLEDAEDHFRTAIAMRESVPYAHRLLGTTLYEKEDLDAARAELEKALELDPTDPISHIFLGNIAGRSGELIEAEDHFTKAIDINPTLPDPYLNLATIRISQGRKDDARTYYEQALQNGAQVNLALEAQLGA